jgi:hypothetical protein
MSYSRRQLEALGEPLGESVTRAKPGGRIYGGGDSAAPTSMTQTSLTYGEEFQPFAKELMKRAGSLASQPYERYQYNRIAGFDPMQLQAQQAAANMRVSPYLAQSAGLAQAASQFQPGSFESPYIQQMAGKSYTPTQFNFERVAGGYDPTKFQAERVAAERAAAERAATGRFTDPGVAQSYMSPYMQNVVDIQKREAQRQGDIAATQRGAEAVRSGAFGGSRQAIMEAEAQRNLAQQMGDIQARGSQAAFEQAAQQFQTDEQRNLAMQQANVQAQLQAALANQQTGLAAALANQAKNLEAQQLSEQSRQFGRDVQMRSDLANQAKQLEAQQLAEQSKQFGAEYGMRGLQSALQAQQEAQRMREQSRQFGADVGLRGAAQLGQLGQTQFGQARDVVGMQATAGAERQAQLQRKLSQDYEDFLAQRKFPYQQQQFAMEMLRGMPMSSTESIYRAPPSAGATAAGLAAMYMGGQRGGYFANGGLTDLALYNMTR